MEHVLSTTERSLIEIVCKSRNSENKSQHRAIYPSACSISGDTGGGGGRGRRIARGWASNRTNSLESPCTCTKWSGASMETWQDVDWQIGFFVCPVTESECLSCTYYVCISTHTYTTNSKCMYVWICILRFCNVNQCHI